MALGFFAPAARTSAFQTNLLALNASVEAARAGEAGKGFAMLGAVDENSSLIDGIARASREQAAAIEEVNAAVRQMDEMTQHNAALVEETNAAIEQTEAQARELDGLVAVFRTGDPDPVAQARVKTALKTAVGQDWEAF